MSQTREIKEGIDGSGRTVYLVFTYRDGRCIHIERFHDKREADAWIKWA